MTLLLTFVALVGCGDDAAADAAADSAIDTMVTEDSGTDAVVDAAADAADSGDDADAVADATSDSSADASDAGSALSGTVSLVVSEAPNTIVAATFGEVSVDTLTSNLFGCLEERRSGACQLVNCDGPLPRFSTAGTLSVDVDGARYADLDPVGGGVYSRLTSSADANPGDAVAFTAAGGEVPAFTVSLTVAGAPSITPPTSIQRADDLTLTWTVGSEGAETMRVAISETASPGRPIVCEVPAADGTLTVTSSLLLELPAMVDATLSITTYNSARVTAGGFEVVATSGSAVQDTVPLE